MTSPDQLQRFLFEDLGIRGEWVRLHSSWTRIRSQRDYPPAVAVQLGQALAAVSLLSATIKFRGSLILQVQGRGPISALVAQATHHRTIRGLARWQDVPETGNLSDIFGAGHIALTVSGEEMESYQGLTGLEGGSLADALATYFQHSEQLPTRLWLAADQYRAAGLFLQELPSRTHDPDDFARVACLAETVSPAELLDLSCENLLYRLFHEENVRLFEPEPVRFRCSCNRRRIQNLLRLLGPEEVRDILRERGTVEVTCEFCNRRYPFDAVDVAALFSHLPAMPALLTRQ